MKQKNRIDKNIRMLIFVILTIIALVGILLGYYLFKGTPEVQNSALTRTKKICPTSTPEPVDQNIDIDNTLKFSPSDCRFSSYEPIVIKSLDTASCKRISQYIIADKTHVYKQQYDPGSSDYSNYIVIKEADPRSFSNQHWGYYKDNTNLYYDTGENYRTVKPIDINSVQVLSISYIKDINGVYFAPLYEQSNIEPMVGFDLASFMPLQNRQNHEQYFKDKNGIYYFGGRPSNFTPSSTKIIQADIKTFTVLGQYLLAKDKNHVYYEGKIVPGIDAETLEVLEGQYYKDAHSVYTVGFTPLPNSDPCTFQLIDYKSQADWSGYAKDINQVYYHDAVVDGADPQTFQAKYGQGIYGGFDKNYQYQGKYKIKR